MPITSSSTFSSDLAGPASRDAWRRFATWFVAATVLLFLATAGLCVVLDPYDTGRFALLRVSGTVDRGPRSATASRARDQSFRGAIIGNSHIQLVSPEQLKEATGVPFVSLIVPATGPGEQLIILDYFLRNREMPPRSLVVGTDGTWCTGNPDLPFWRPFPAWLYDPSPWTYLAGLVRYDTLKRLPRRISLALGKARPARPDGYWDYEEHRVWRPDTVLPVLAKREATTDINATGRYPALDALSARLDRLPRDVAIVLVRPPVYINTLPEPGTEAARSEEACRAAIASLAKRHGARLVDWRTDRPENRVPENYFDLTHYRSNMARALEAEIAAAIVKAAP